MNAAYLRPRLFPDVSHVARCRCLRHYSSRFRLACSHDFLLPRRDSPAGPSVPFHLLSGTRRGWVECSRRLIRNTINYAHIEQERVLMEHELHSISPNNKVPGTTTKLTRLSKLLS